MDYSKFLLQLRAICLKKGYKLVKIGAAKKGFPLYKIIINSQGKKTVCFSAGIHGDEIAGPLAILQFLKKFPTARYSQTRILIFPMVNPTGFEANQRYNFEGKDLNRLFCLKNLSGENLFFHNEISKEKITFFHSLHEDPDMREFYLYIQKPTPHQLIRNIRDTAAKYFPIYAKSSIYGDRCYKGIITNVGGDGSFEDRLQKDGVPYIMCSETPGRAPIKKRIELSIKIMKQVLDFVDKPASKRHFIISYIARGIPETWRKPFGGRF